MDWSRIELKVFLTAKDGEAEGRICLPGDQKLAAVRVAVAGHETSLPHDPLSGRVRWDLELQPAR